MNRRAFVGVAISVVGSLALGRYPTAMAQSALITEGVRMMARREFTNLFSHLRTDVYWLGTREDAKKAFDDFCAWASQDNDDGWRTVTEIEDISETAEILHGSGGRATYPEFSKRVDQAKFFLGKAKDPYTTKLTYNNTIVLQWGNLIHVWRLTEMNYHLLFSLAEGFFDDAPDKLDSYDEEDLLRNLPTLYELPDAFTYGRKTELVTETVETFD